MKSKQWTLLLVLVALLTIAGCASNPKGGFGPSWDVPIRVPLAQNETKTIEEFLEDAPEEVKIPDGVGELIRIEDSINEADKVKNFDIGSDLLAEVNNNLPEVSDAIELNPITVEDIASDINPLVPVSGGLNDGNLSGIDLGFGSAFESVTFSSDAANVLQVSVTNNASNVTVDSLDLTLNNPAGANQTITLTNISSGVTDSGTWDLTGETLPNGDVTGNYATVDITATTSGSGSGDLDLTIGFPNQVEISKVTDLEAPNINETIDFDPIVYDDDFEGGLEKVAFSQGNLGVNIDPDNQLSALDFAVTDLQIATLKDTDNDDPNDGNIDLTDNELDLTNGVTIDFKLEITNNSDTLTYDSSNNVVVAGGFTNTEIESVDLDSGQFRGITNADLGLDPSDRFDLNATLIEGIDIPDQADDIELNNPTISLNLQGLNGFELNLGSLVFKALDSSGATLETYQPNLKITGASRTFDITEDDDSGVNFLDLLQTPDTQDIVVEGGFNADDITATGATTQFNNDTTVGINSVSANIPLDFEIVNPTSEVLVSSVDTLDQDEVDNIKDGVKRFEIMLKEITNQFGLEIEAQVYLASLNRDYGDVDDLSDNELDELEAKVAQEENILAVSNQENQGFTIEATTGDNTIDKQLMVNPDEADRLRGDNLYFGIKVTVPKTDSVNLKTGDQVSITDAFAVLTAKVNQDND